MRLIALLACLLLLPACTTNAIRGLVVRGPETGISVVNKDDKRLEQPGLEGAVLELVIDPDTISPNRLPPAITDERGWFEAPIKEPGAGVLEYELMIVCRMPGYAGAAQTIPLPGGNKVLLITLAPGRDRTAPSSDILRDTMKVGEQLESR